MPDKLSKAAGILVLGGLLLLLAYATGGPLAWRGAAGLRAGVADPPSAPVPGR